MKRVWLWGAGEFVEQVIYCVHKETQICGIFDNAEHLAGSKKNDLNILIPDKSLVGEQDVIIITILRYEDVVSDIKVKLNMSELQVVPFFDVTYDKKIANKYLDIQKWAYTQERILLRYQLNSLQVQLNNLEYEIADKICKQRFAFPKIESGEAALELIINNNKSMCRFGDGEFEIMLGRARPFFQKPERELGERLKQILVNNEEKMVTCIADNYGCLDQYTDKAARNIRMYLTPNVRSDHMKLIDCQKKYYDAYVSRPYIWYRNKELAAERFGLWKQVWNNKDIVLVEGEYTRSGYLNDLFLNAKSVRRVLCPAEQAWDSYQKIYEFIIKNIGTDRIILIALGPAATVLAFDLMQTGYQAIDMGHLDNEYEWFLRNAEDVINITYKYVNDYSAGKSAEEINDIVYEEQIIGKIGC